MGDIAIFRRSEANMLETLLDLSGGIPYLDAFAFKENKPTLSEVIKTRFAYSDYNDPKNSDIDLSWLAVSHSI